MIMGLFVMKINLFPPAIVHETTRLKSWQQARQFWFFVQHRPDTNNLTMEHEFIHVWQFWLVGALASIVVWFLFWPLWFMGFSAHNVLISVSKFYRKHAEAMAFAASVEHGATLAGAAEALATHYKLGITEFEAERLIKWYMELIYD